MFERDQPCTVEEFDATLRADSSIVVLCPNHLLELAAPLALAGPRSSVMRTLNKLESLPLSYVNEREIPRLELVEALNAFRSGREVRSIDPYVDRMDAAVLLAGPSPTRNFLHYPLAEIAFDLWHNRPDVFRKGPELAARFRLGVGDRRSRGGAGGDCAEFATTLPELVALCDLKLRGSQVNDFAQWVWDSPHRCPGISLWFKVRHEIMRNRTDRIKNSDLVDLSWILVLPYLEVATLDRRMRSYVESVSLRNPDARRPQILPSLAEVLESLQARLAADGSPNRVAGGV